MFKALTKEIKEIPDLLNQKYLPTLDGIRAVAVCLVIIAHINDRVYHNEFLSHLGNLGVYIFFVLSGFLITTLLLKEKATTGTISLKDFYRRRFFRIVPVAYLFLIVIIILKFLFKLPIGITDLLLCFFFLRRFNHFSDQYYTSHFWSLSFEEQYYIIYPFILKKSLKLYVGIIFFILTLHFVYAIPSFKQISIPGKNFLYAGFISSFEGIGIGSLFSILIFQGKINITKRIRGLTIINVLLITGIVGLHTLDIAFPVKIFSSICIAFFVVLNINKVNQTFFFNVLNSRPLIFIGKLSYSLYIWQQIFSRVLPWNGLFPYSDSVLLNLIALFVVAYCSYNFYEKFFLRFRYKRAKTTGGGVLKKRNQEVVVS